MNDDTTIPTDTADVSAETVDETQNLLQEPSSPHRTLYIALGVVVLLIVGFLYFSYSNAVPDSAIKYPTEGGIIVENGVSTFSGLLVTVGDVTSVEVAPGDVEYSPDLSPRIIQFDDDTQILREGDVRAGVKFSPFGLRVGEMVVVTVSGDISTQKTVIADTITVQAY